VTLRSRERREQRGLGGVRARGNRGCRRLLRRALRRIDPSKGLAALSALELRGAVSLGADGRYALAVRVSVPA